MERSAPALIEAATRLGVKLDVGQAEQLLAHVELLERWSTRHNLVGPGTPEQWLERHTLDSLAAEPFLPSGPVLDIGSGAGFPGLPVAVARPDCRLTLVEPRQKRAAFLRNAVATCGLVNAVIEERSVGKGERGAFTAAISRATWPLPRLLELAAPLVASGGRVVAFLGADDWSPEKLSAAGAPLSLDSAELHRYVAGGEPERRLAVFRRR